MSTKKSVNLEEVRKNKLIHLKKTIELSSVLKADLERFRFIEEGNGINDSSILQLEKGLASFNALSHRLRFVVSKSIEVYNNMKDLYMSFQDTKSYIGQAMSRPATTSKEIFSLPFQQLALNLTSKVQVLLNTLDNVSSADLPNPSLLCIQYQLGIAYMYGLEGKCINHAKAFDSFKNSSDKGNIEAMLCLSHCYLHGKGVDKSESKGLECLANAANSGICPKAQNDLAMLIINNIKERNPYCVKEYCASLMDDRSTSIRNNNTATGTNTGSTANSNEYTVEDAIKLLLVAALEGSVEAKCSLGGVYEEAGDLDQAADWYAQAANEDSAHGAYLLGHLYLKGKLSVSKTRTFSLLKYASRGGQNEAFHDLGVCYEHGIGVDANISIAIDYYRRSAKEFNKLSMYNLGYILVQQAIEINKKLNEIQPYNTIYHNKTMIQQPVLIEQNQKDQKYSEYFLLKERILQEGIHWLRMASEYHIKDAGFQLGRLYEQGIGVPNDTFAALANYKWAAHLGHTKAAFFAGNLLFSHANTYNPSLFPEAAVYYHQAAIGGHVEAMNSYGILLEDGRASELGVCNIHLAAAWYYQACIEEHPVSKAYINLAMLLLNTPLSSFRTILGDIITLSEIKEFLLDYFEVKGSCEEEKREVLLQMVDRIDTSVNNTKALPLIEEVSVTYSAPARRTRDYGYNNHNSTASISSSSHIAGNHIIHSSRHQHEGQEHGAQQYNSSAKAALDKHTKIVAVTTDDDDPQIDFTRIPSTGHTTADNTKPALLATQRMNNRIQEEVHKLSRGPIHNNIHNRNLRNNVLTESSRSVSPVLHDHPPREGEIYTTDGPVVPPNFVPRAMNVNVPAFKPDKPPPHTKPRAPISASTSLQLRDTPAVAPAVPNLVSPRKQHSEQQAPPRPPRHSTSFQHQPIIPHTTSHAPTTGSIAPTALPTTQQSDGTIQRTLSSQRALHSPLTTAPQQQRQQQQQSSQLQEIAKKTKATKRLSFISGLVHMMARNGDHTVSEEGKSSAGEGSPVVQPTPAAATPTGRSSDPMRQSVDSSQITQRRPSMWKTLKNATGTSKSLDFSSRNATPDPHRAPPPPLAQTEVDPFASHAKFVSRSNSLPNPLSTSAVIPPPVRSSSPADGVFASEPQAVPSPSKPPKPVAKQPSYTTGAASPGLPIPQSQQSEYYHPQMHSTPPQASPVPLQEEQQTNATIGIDISSPAASPIPTTARTNTGAEAPTTTAVVQNQSSNVSINSQKSSGNKQSTITKLFLTARHQKYLRNTPEATATESSNIAEQAATSTGTIETVGIEGVQEENHDLVDDRMIQHDASEMLSDLSMSSRDIRY